MKTKVLFEDLKSEKYRLYPKIDVVSKRTSVGAFLREFQNENIVRVDLLQREFQEEGWEAKDNKRAKEYLESLFNGMAATQPFILVKRELIVRKLEEKINSLNQKIKVSGTDVTGEKALKSQLERLLKDLNNEFREAELVVLDGQNRLFLAITRFFIGQKGKDSKWLAQAFKGDQRDDDNFLRFTADKAIQLVDAAGNLEEINNFTVQDLPQAVIDALYESKVLYCEVVNCRDFDDLSELWLVHNEGIPAAPFPKILMKHQLTYIGKIVENLGRHKDPSNPVFTILCNWFYIRGHGMTNQYSKDKNGMQKLVTEFAYYHLTGSWPDIEDLDKFMQNTAEFLKQRENALKEAIMIFENIAGHLEKKLDDKKMLPKQYTKENHIICYGIMFSLLLKRNEGLINRNFFGEDNEQIFKFDDILLKANFLDKFTKWIYNQKSAEHNPKAFHKYNGKTTPLKGTLPWSKAGNGREYIKAKETALINFLTEFWPKMHERNIVNSLGYKRRTISDMTQMKYDIACTNDYVDNIIGFPLDDTDISNSEIDHFSSFGGNSINNPNDLENLGVTSKDVNRKKAAKM